MAIQRAKFSFSPDRQTEQIKISDLFMARDTPKISWPVTDAVVIWPKMVSLVARQLPEKFYRYRYIARQPGIAWIRQNSDKTVFCYGARSPRFSARFSKPQRDTLMINVVGITEGNQ
jgi:hypothetical protein